MAQQYAECVLPYRMVGGKMIVDMKMNGQLRPFIFDTGGQTALTEEVCEELGLSMYDQREITDVNGNKSTYHRVLIGELADADVKVAFKHVPAILVPKPSPFVCFKVVGIIGSDLLKYFVVEIDGKTKTIKLSTKPTTLSLRKMLPFEPANGMPVIKLQAGSGNSLTTLFDTGYPGFISLKESDFNVLTSQSAFEIVTEGYGEGSIGLGGMAGIDTLYRVCFPVVSLGACDFENVTATTATPPYTLLGMKLLDYGKVTLDYPKARFYFEPYEEKAADLTSKHYRVELRVKDGDLVATTVWGDLRKDIKIGDKVLKINGAPAGKYDFCESILNGIPELKKKKVNKLTFSTAEGEKVITYKKE